MEKLSYNIDENTPFWHSMKKIKNTLLMFEIYCLIYHNRAHNEETIFILKNVVHVSFRHLKRCFIFHVNLTEKCITLFRIRKIQNSFPRLFSFKFYFYNMNESNVKKSLKISNFHLFH